MAENLLRRVSEASQEPATPLSGGFSRTTPPQATTSKRREQVQAACDSCRRKKIKCNAQRPCAACAKKKKTCRYSTREGETRPRALKRRADDLARSNDSYTDLFQLLGNWNECEAAEVFRRIQRGYSPDAILRSMTAGNAIATVPGSSRRAHDMFMANLAYSTGSLEGIIKLAGSIVDPSIEIELLTPADLRNLRDRIVELPYLEHLVQQSWRRSITSPTPSNNTASETAEDPTSPISNGQELPLSYHDWSQSSDAPHRVPAASWTTITDSDEAVSHLVSLFLAWINPTWRFVVPDLFLRGMRSKNLKSEFCSPFLVNAICAIACLHTEHDVAFAHQDRERITRGQNFHDEAVRLWILEESLPTIVNVQALCTLSLDSNYRAKDKLGLALVATAMRLNNNLPLHVEERRYAAQGFCKYDFARARLSTHWTAKCTHVIMSIAFLSPAITDGHATLLPQIEDVFEDESEYWSGYPLSRDMIPHRPMIYLQERCRLAEIFQELQELILSGDARDQIGIREFAISVETLAGKMRHWRQNLHEELRYEWPVSVAVWELHASYLAFLMTLWLMARTRFQAGQNPSIEELASTEAEADATSFKTRMAEEALSEAIPLAHTAAQILRDFRERYGFKVLPAWLLQLQAVTAGVLLLDPVLLEQAMGTTQDGRDANAVISDSRTAFEEVFRGLSGAGVQVMIARGIARMMYHTALKLKIALSPSTRSMLQIMADTAWRPSDLSLVNSSFPNFATTKGHEDSERMSEILSKWERLEI